MKIAIAIGVLILVMNIVFSFSLIFIERKDPTTTWAWLLIMILLPGIGFIIYLLFMKNKERKNNIIKKKATVFGFIILCLGGINSIIYNKVEYRDRIIPMESISMDSLKDNYKILKKELDIPVFHDDQHGTAIIVSAGILNAVKLAGKKMEDLEIVINGAGSAGMAIAKMLLNLNVKNRN